MQQLKNYQIKYIGGPSDGGTDIRIHAPTQFLMVNQINNDHLSKHMYEFEKVVGSVYVYRYKGVT